MLADILLAARLHDIGKSIVPDDILLKQGPLSQEEWEIIKAHPAAGEEIIRPISRFRNISGILRNYREHFDGSGYPDGLKGDEIPIGARILSVVDAYGSMLEKRAYKPALSPKEALSELTRCQGAQFDPEVVNTFIDIINGEPS